MRGSRSMMATWTLPFSLSASPCFTRETSLERLMTESSHAFLLEEIFGVNPASCNVWISKRQGGGFLFLAEEEDLVLQVGQVQHLLLCQRVPDRETYGKVILAVRDHGIILCETARVVDKRGIQNAGLQTPEHIFGGSHAYINDGFRVTGFKCGEERGDAVIAGESADSQRDPVGGIPPDGVSSALICFFMLHDSHCVRNKRAAIGCQLDFLRGARKQRRAELLLQLFNMAGERGLIDAKLSCGI